MSMAGVSITVDKAQVEHVNKLLANAPEKALTVYRRAFDRGLKAARTQASREITSRYAIKAENLRTYETIRSRIDTNTDGVTGYINFAGAKIPLYRFNPKPKDRQYTSRYVNGVGGWRITTDVYAADLKGKGQMIRRRTAFIATFQSGHKGLFYRVIKQDPKTGKQVKTSGGKVPLEEMWGFSVADMLDYKPAREAIQERARQVVEERIDHELLRTLEEQA
jgi:hypothetical protein